jgi:hypothetical protein
MKCDSNNPMQKFNFDADSGVINMVNAPDKCVTFGEKFRIPAKLESCSEDTRFGVELQRGGDRTYKLQIETFDRAGGKSKPANQIEVVQKTIDYSKKPIRLCAGVRWKRRTRSPRNYQNLAVRQCDENNNKRAWMDKFSYDEEKLEVRDATKGNTCWTFHRPRKSPPRVITYTCTPKKARYQKWIHDVYSGAFCLKSRPDLCINTKAAVNHEFTLTQSKVSAFGNL